MGASAVFVCHAPEDSGAAADLVRDLERLGLDVWVDQLLVGGQRWWDGILEAIRGCDVFAFVLSGAALESQICSLELEFAVALDRSLVPIAVAPVSPRACPPVLAQLQWLDYGERTPDAVALLARVLSSIPVRPLPDPLPPPPQFPVGATLASRYILDAMATQPAGPSSNAAEAGAPASPTDGFTIFISYRRDDSEDVTGRIRDRLKSRFGASTVFLDIDSVPPGIDFRIHIAEAVQSCDVVLVVVGRRWLEVADDSGQPRIHDDRDFVREEIRSALARNIPTIPVLVQHATHPKETDLPDDIKNLAYRTSLPVRPGADFDTDIARLIDALMATATTSGKTA